MKIIYYSPHPILSLHSPAGYATHMKEMMQAFRELGHEVVPLILGDQVGDLQLAATPASTPGGKRIAKKIIPAKLWESLKDFSLRRFDKYAATKLEELIRSEKPDMVYERSNYLQVSGVTVCKRLGIRHVLEVNAPYVEERVVLSGTSFLLNLARKREAVQLRMTDKIVVVSTALEAHFIKEFQLPPEKFLVTPNAINPHLTKEMAGHPFRKNQLGIEPDQVVFGFVGSIFPWHGLDILIEAFTRLAEANEQVRLVIVGDGEILPKLKAQAASGLLEKKIIFTGSIPHTQVFSYINAMDICIMAKSNWYGSPIKLFEYGLLGKPIIAPDTVPVQDVMEHLTTGYLVRPSVEEMFTAMQWMILNPEAAVEIGTAFQKKILQHHLWKHNAEAVLS